MRSASKAFYPHVSQLKVDEMFRCETDVKKTCNGTPNFSAQCTCAKLGGFAMIASATNALGSLRFRAPPLFFSPFCFIAIPAFPVPSEGSKQACQLFPTISRIIFLFRQMSPDVHALDRGISPGLATMYAINSCGEPPRSKNSIPWLSTKSRKTLCVARRTRWP